MKRIQCLKWIPIAVAFALFLSLTPQIATAADNYPTRPITIVCGYAAGGASDIYLRALVEAARKVLNQPFVIVFKPGGATSVSLSLLKGEKPDGYTLGLLAVGGVRAAMLQDVPYNPLEDFTHIMQFGEYQFGCAVRGDAPWKTMKELLEYAKNNPNKLSYGSPGVGAGGHLVMEKLEMDYGIKCRHVPFEGDSASIAAALGGHIDFLSGGAGAWRNYYDSGKLRFLALYTEKRVDSHPGVPTLLDSGYKVAMSGPVGIAGPKGLPEPVLKKLDETFKQCMADKTFLKTIEDFGVYAQYRGPKEFTQYLQKMVAEDTPLIKKIKSKN